MTTTQITPVNFATAATDNAAALSASVISAGTSSLRVKRCVFTKVRRDQTFGRVQAKVLITIQYHPSLPPRTETLLTSVPFSVTDGKGSLRARLIRDAVNLAVLMDRADRRSQSLAA